jgi:hypothetical protein
MIYGYARVAHGPPPALNPEQKAEVRMRRVEGATLKGYFDESGKDNDPAVPICAFAGYIGTAENWTMFETLWRDVLSDFEVPYLHMREFANNKWPYKKWANLDGLKTKEEFSRSLIGVIGKCQLTGFGSAVWIKDLQRFNNETGLDIDAYSLGMYGCFLDISEKYPNDKLQLFVDNFSGVSSKINKARGYSLSDSYYPERAAHFDNNITVTPLVKSSNIRTVVPIQAADFAAWEVRKSATGREEWFTAIKPGLSPEDWVWSRLVWDAEKHKGKPIPIPLGHERKSFAAPERVNDFDTAGFGI